ncbi:MAG: glutamate--tRNA ligase [Rickettsiaceae bacterium]|nr:glutamate--tRNA ligase [Rickettsiaceae bacterium]
MTQIITRFAPSPTGKLHIGNVRTALINWLYAKKHNGQFILRMDDTDVARNKDEYKEAIKNDLKWLGLEWDSSFNQSSRLDKYEVAKQDLLKKNRLYPCYETPEELEIKRKLQLSRGKPPIYDRSSLNLTKNQIAAYEAEGRTPHYRFLINDSEIQWNDLVKGSIKYQGAHLGDPVIIRADGSMTYMLCSTVDDIEYKTSHIIRGEDHVSNTAVQIQMFKAMDSTPPEFGHLSLVKSKDDKISKRLGGFDIESLKNDSIEAMAINSFLAFIGSSLPVSACNTLEDLIEQFDITKYSKSPTTYMPEELEIINHKLIINYEFKDAKSYLKDTNLDKIDEQFWLAVRPNLKKMSDLKEWWQICSAPTKVKTEDPQLLAIAAKTLPEEINENTWKEWTRKIGSDSGKKGKELFMPIRLALTGQATGPELQKLLPLLSREEILKRLN